MFTPLMSAVLENWLVGVKILLEHKGVDVNFMEPRDCANVMHKAAENGNSAILKLLLEREDIEVDKVSGKATEAS